MCFPLYMPNATSSTVAINGYAIREIRKAKNLSPASVAEAMKRDRTYIVKMEKGAVDRIGTETFKRLCAALALEDVRAIQALPAVAAIEDSAAVNQ